MFALLKKAVSIFLILILLLTSGVPITSAQQPVTPTVYCVGGVGAPPCAPIDPTSPSASPFVSVSPSLAQTTSTPTSSTNPPTSPSPTVEPCESQNSIQHWGGKKKKKFKGGKRGNSGGGFFEMFIEFLRKFIEWFMGGGGGQMPTLPDPGQNPEPTDEPDRGDEPDPCDAPEPSDTPDPSDEPEPSDDPEPTQGQNPVSPTSGSAISPTAMVTPGQATTAPTGGTTAGACVPTSGELEDQDFDDSQLPWKRNGAAKVNINFSTEGVPAEWVTEMQRGATAWNRSACLDVRLVPSCNGVQNCIPVEIGDGGGDDGNFNSDEEGGFTVGGSIQILSSLTGGSRTNVTVHEMGHAVGLRHRLGRVLMNIETFDDITEPDEIDYRNLLRLYGSQQ